MATKAPEVKVPIGLEDKLSKKLGKLQNKLKKFGDKMGKIGSKMSTRVTLPLTIMGGAIIKSAADFETSMNNVSALTGATGEQFDKLRNQAKELGATTQFSASETADAMGFMAQAGMDANEVYSQTPGILKLAAAGQIELAEAADMATNILEPFKKTGVTLTQVNEALAVASSHANTNVTEMGEAFKFVAPVAANMGIGMQETAAAMGLLGNAGIKASMAGTSLRKVMSSLAAPSGAAASALNDLQIKRSDIQDSEGNLKSLRSVIQAFEKSGASAGQVMTIFGERAGPAMLSLISQGSGALDEMNKKIGKDGAATLARLAETRMKGLNGALKSMRSALEGIAIAIADSGILDFMTKLVLKLTAVFRRITKLSPTLLKVGFVIGALVAAIGPALVVMGTLASSIATLITVFKTLKIAWLALNLSFSISPIGLIIIGVLALVAAGVALYKNWDKVKKFFISLWEVIKTFYTKHEKVIRIIMIPVAPLLAAGIAIYKNWSKITELFGKLWGKMKSVGGKFKSFFTGDDNDITAEVGVKKMEEANATFNENRKTEGQVDVNFSGNVPEGVMVKPTTQGDVNMNMNMALGTQGGG